MIDQMQLNVGF